MSVCIANDEYINSQDLQKISLIQLVLMHDEYKLQGELLGKPVKVTGTLFTQHTGHHYTGVLMKVKDIIRETKD